MYDYDLYKIYQEVNYYKEMIVNEKGYIIDEMIRK